MRKRLWREKHFPALETACIALKRAMEYRPLMMHRNPDHSNQKLVRDARTFVRRHFLGFVAKAAILLSVCCTAVAEPKPAATATFNAYVYGVESRLAQQHQSADSFLAPANRERLRSGELIIDKLAPSSPAGYPGAMLHHWRGTAFAPGAKAADFERLMRDFNAYPQYYAPQVIQSKILSQQEDHYKVVMRVRQHHVITVVMDTAYDLSFEHSVTPHTGASSGYSISRSTRISEIESAGTPSEHALAPGDDHGFLWRLNTYWSYEERNGGLYLQIESASLTRAIPTGLGWVIGPFVESVPRESMEFTLRATCNALKKVDIERTTR